MLGRRGAVQGGLLKVGLARTDLHVTVRGTPIRPALALGGWVAFKPSGGGDVVLMGDLVLTERELGPVLSALQRGGIGQWAVHKHLPEHQPSLWWMHVHGQGKAVNLAATLHGALALTGTPSGDGPAPPAAPPPLDLDTAAIRTALGRPGHATGGVYQLGASRIETVRALDIDVPPSMGVGTSIGFQSTGRGTAIVSGDLVMTAVEIDPVLRALRDHDIDVVSVHNHLVGEEPRLFFVHFWGEGESAALARGLRAALDRTNVR